MWTTHCGERLNRVEFLESYRLQMLYMRKLYARKLSFETKQNIKQTQFGSICMCVCVCGKNVKSDKKEEDNKYIMENLK